MTISAHTWQQKASVLRYVVPFYLKNENNESESSYSLYETACNRIDQDNRWTTQNALLVQEDLYEHIVAQMSPQVKGFGRAWLLETPKNGKHASFSFLVSDNQALHFDMINAGLFLFSTAIGFLWYEITPKTSSKDFSIEMLLQFQNRFKELAHSNARLVENSLAPNNPQLTDKRLKYIPITDWDAFQHHDSQDSLSPVELLYIKSNPDGKNVKNDVVRSISRQRLADLIKQYGLSWTLTGTGTEPQLSIAQVQTDSEEMEYRLYPTFRPANLICSSLPSTVRNAIQYFSNVTRNNLGFDGYRLEPAQPDKALPFCYLQADFSDRDELQQLACRLSKGYHDHYHLSKSMWNNCIELFDNAFCHAGREGCAYVNSSENATLPFFDSGFQFRFRSAYFLLYILALHQHYGLLYYARKIALELSSDPNEYMCCGTVANQMESLVLEINTFLMKSEYSSVSNIQHHNTFYQHLRQQMAIEADMASLKNGLESLTEIQRNYRDQQEHITETALAHAEQQRDRKTQYALGLLSLLTLFSAFGDSLASVTGFVTQIQELFFVPGNFIADAANFVGTFAFWGVVGCVGWNAYRLFKSSSHEHIDPSKDKSE